MRWRWWGPISTLGDSSPRGVERRPATLRNGTAAPGRPWVLGSRESGQRAGGERDQSLYAGGYFTTAGGCRGVAKGTAARGQPWAQGWLVATIFQSPRWWRAGPISTLQQIFTMGGLVAANYIVKWNGSTLVGSRGN